MTYLEALGTRPRNTPEEDFHIGLVQHIRWRLRKGVIFWHTPNGGARSKASAGKLKAMGVRPGVFDLMFIIPVSGEPPAICFLELKAGRNKMSTEQNIFAAELDKLGIPWAVSYSIDHAIQVLEAWQAIKPEAKRR